MALWKPPQEDDEMELTAMIDIVFLLIAFFMVVAKLVDDQKIPLEVPIADQSSIVKNAGRMQYINISEKGDVYWSARRLGNSEEVLDSLQQQVGDAKKLDPSLKIYVRADARVAHRHVRDVMKATAGGEIFDIAFAAYSTK